MNSAARGGLGNLYGIAPSITTQNTLYVLVAGAGRYVQRTHPSGLNSSKGSWLCDWLWPISSRTHLVLQALEDQTPSRMLRARHLYVESAVMSDIATQKQAVREAAMVTRKAAHAAATGAGELACAHLMAWLGADAAPRIVSAYMPIQSELDIRPAMKALHHRGFKVCLPVIIEKGQPLKFRAWTPQTPMIRGPFGAKVPESGAWLRPDLLLCPLLAFDASGQRMGYGGGFYDRSIAALKAEKPVQALGYAYAAQQVDAVPHEATDQALDGVITEAGFFTLSGQ